MKCTPFLIVWNVLLSSSSGNRRGRNSGVRRKIKEKNLEVITWGRNQGNYVASNWNNKYKRIELAYFVNIDEILFTCLLTSYHLVKPAELFDEHSLKCLSVLFLTFHSILAELFLCFAVLVPSTLCAEDGATPCLSINPSFQKGTWSKPNSKLPEFLWRVDI